MKSLPIVFLVIIALSACGPSQNQVETAIAETITAEALLVPPTSTHVKLPPTEIIPPTSTPTPLPISTPTLKPTVPSHPIKFQDDFSNDTGNWVGCAQCNWKNGAMYMGPYPISGAYIQHYAICVACGQVTNYRMAVDVTYEDGPSERGFGFLLRLSEDYLVTFEITTWQTVGVWKLDINSNGWIWVNGVWSGSVRPGVLTNHIEVEVTGAGTGKSNIALVINGKTVLVLFNQSIDQTPIGLTLYGHAIEVYFDNFEFEEYEPYGIPQDTIDYGDVSG